MGCHWLWKKEPVHHQSIWSFWRIRCRRVARTAGSLKEVQMQHGWTPSGFPMKFPAWSFLALRWCWRLTVLCQLISWLDQVNLLPWNYKRALKQSIVAKEERDSLPHGRSLHEACRNWNQCCGQLCLWLGRFGGRVCWKGFSPEEDHWSFPAEYLQGRSPGETHWSALACICFG